MVLGELGETHQPRRVREEFAAKPRMKNRNWLCIKEETRGNVPGVRNSVCHPLAAGENKPFQRPLQGRSPVLCPGGRGGTWCPTDNGVPQGQHPA